MRIALPIAAACACLPALLLAGCNPAEDAAVEVVAIGAPSAPFERGVRLSPTGRLVRGATIEGLVGFDEQGQVIPAMADRWIVTDDGLSYIFRLRDGAWADGSELSASSARAALRSAISALRETPFALDLAGIDEIRAMTGRVIEIRLAAPLPNLLQLLAQPELGLTWRGRGAGPMQLQRNADGSALLTAVPPDKRGLPAVEQWDEQVRPLQLTALGGAAAVERFNSGKADILLGGRFETFPLARSVGLLRATIQLDPVIGLFGLAVVHGGGFLAAPENREAVAMAIDRDALTAPLEVRGWTATTRIVAPGIEDETGALPERWTGLSLDERRAQAAARVTRWRKTQPAAAEPLRVRIALPDGLGADLLFARLQADLATIGIEALRTGLDADAELRLIDMTARYPRSAWFLNQLSCTAARGLCDAAADRLAGEAQRATDPAVRTALTVEAEVALTKANVFIPFGAPIRWSLVRGAAPGFAPNRWGIHPLMPLARRPK